MQACTPVFGSNAYDKSKESYTSQTMTKIKAKAKNKTGPGTGTGTIGKQVNKISRDNKDEGANQR